MLDESAPHNLCSMPMQVAVFTVCETSNGEAIGVVRRFVVYQIFVQETRINILIYCRVAGNL